MGECVSKQAGALANANKANVAKACKAEMADTTFLTTHDNKTFDQFYGTNAWQRQGQWQRLRQLRFPEGKRQDCDVAECTQVNAAKKCKSAPLKDQIGAAPKTTATSAPASWPKQSSPRANVG